MKLKEAGEVLKIELQPSLMLLEKFERNGKKYRAITYAPDFLVSYSDGKQAYIDVKMMSTQASDLRRKMFAQRYDTPLLWIAKSIKWGTEECPWINYDELVKLRRNAKKTKEVHSA